MTGLMELLRSPRRCILVLIVFMGLFDATELIARQSLSVLFGPMCIRVSDLAEDSGFKTRNDLAELVSRAVRVKVEADKRESKRKVWAASDFIQPDQPGFDHQLTLELSVKRQRIRLDGGDWNVVVASGVSTNGLIQDREVQPVIVIQPQVVPDDRIVEALVEFVDRTVLAALRRE